MTYLEFVLSKWNEKVVKLNLRHEEIAEEDF